MKITIKNVTKSFGSKVVINNVSLEIESGSFTTLLGPSGCGKTTLLRMIAGLETPDNGEIYFGEKVVFSSEKGINIPPEKRGLGFVFQDFALWPHLTVYENVAFARAIVIEPECILFDEPLSALDALLREDMRTELKELMTKYHITAVFVTHDQTEAMSMSDKIAVLNSGSIDQYDTPVEVYERPSTEFAARFVGSSNWIDAKHMFRPEKAKLLKNTNDIAFETQVVSYQFLGNMYQNRLAYQDQYWIYLTHQKLDVGSNITLHISKKDIIEL